MTSKEKIVDIRYLIMEHYSDSEPLDNSQRASRNCFFKYCYEITQDLERLERLEEFLKLCLTKYVPLDYLSSVFYENKKMYLKDLKDLNYDYYLYLCDEVCEYQVNHKNKLTLKEFEFIHKLLKEVINNEIS